MPDADHAIVISPELYERLVAAVRDRFPIKSFGYLVSKADPYEPTDVLFFEGNIRNDRFWKPTFEAYGRYFVDHSDAGFVATPEESWAIQQEMLRRGVVEVGVFHSHQRHPANFSRIDYEMHRQRFASLWHLIISFRNASYPRMRAFDVSDSGVHELPIRIPSGAVGRDA
jgi:proteasome lid subunit RPN8/RPN11